MNVTLLILAWNAVVPLQRCLERVFTLDPAPDQVMVVDNGSHDGSADMVVHAFPTVHLIRNEANLGFGRGMNVGLRALMAQTSPPDLIVLLNQDTLVDVGWLGALTSAMSADPTLGAVGCKIRYPDGRIQHAGLILERPRALAHHIGWYEADDGRFDQPMTMEFVTGAALALRRTTLEQVGLFDEGYAQAYFEDVDLLWRIRRNGYRVGYEPRATLVHHESLSLPDPVTRGALYNRGRLRFVFKSYPLDELFGSFADAERRFAAQHAHLAEGRVLRWAYHESLANVDSLVAARCSLEPELPEVVNVRMRALLHELYQTLIHTLYQQAITTAKEIRAL
jgi:GT2 family glycosyltransferase